MKSGARKRGPGEKKLARFAGSWKTVSEMKSPDGTVLRDPGTWRARMAIGGLWLLHDYSSTFAGKRYEGHGVMGYDPDRKVYVGDWVSTWSKRISHSEGTFDAKGRLVMEGDEISPEGKPFRMRHVYEFGKGRYRMTFILIGSPDLELGWIDYRKLK
jgi:hypothetical protein